MSRLNGRLDFQVDKYAYNPSESQLKRFQNPYKRPPALGLSTEKFHQKTVSNETFKNFYSESRAPSSRSVRSENGSAYSYSGPPIEILDDSQNSSLGSANSIDNENMVMLERKMSES